MAKKEVGKSKKREASKSSSSDSDSVEEETVTPKVAKIDLLRKQGSQRSFESFVMMEDLCKRFPALAKKLLQNLDDQSLVIFKETSRDIYSVSTNERAYWLRIIQKYSGNLLEFQNSWKKVLNKIPCSLSSRSRSP